MFIGRRREIGKLNKRYKSGQFEFMVVYGRRRVGKTRLLTEFCKDKESIFFVAEEQNDASNLKNFSEIVFNTIDKPEYMSSFDSWEMSFKFIIDKMAGRRLVVVLDEFPYLAGANAGILSMFQNMIDHEMINTQLFFVLCGSSMSFMENEVLAHKSPLFGRRTGQMLIKPFNYLESAEFFPKYSIEDKLTVYGILGGSPQYLLQFDGTCSIRENIIYELLDNTAYLYDEPRNLLHQELRSPAVYNSIIEAIASGETQLNRIAAKTKEDSKKVDKYIKILIDLHLIRRDHPIGKKPGRKSLLFLQDNLFTFIYRFVYKYKSLIEQDKGEYVYEKLVEPFLSEYMGFIFEQVCMEYLVERSRINDLPVVINKIGRWWGNNPIKKKEEEIDIVAEENDKRAIIGECKYKNSLFTKGMFNGLVEKSSLLPYKEKFYFLFSKSGFEESLKKEAAANDKVFLITPVNLYNI